MFDTQEYQLLDFGAGRRLERFGPIVLDRPCPAADAARPAAAELWQSGVARFELGPSESRPAERGRWILRGQPPSCWTIAHGPLTFELNRTDFGHVGLFPEQAENWDWITEQVARRMSHLARPLKVLNLFAYTGGSTLAAAAAGAEVTHVDAARNVVAWARRNADISGLGKAPIRWIPDDAMKFAARELRRGNRYDAVILDPPSYGHGAGGEAWQLARHLPELLALCAHLTAPGPQFVLLTCHTPGYTPERLRDLLAAALSTSAANVLQSVELTLRASTGQSLPSGIVVRCASPSKTGG